MHLDRYHQDVIPIIYPISQLQIHIPISTTQTSSLPTKNDITKPYILENTNYSTFLFKSSYITILLDPKDKCDKVQPSYTSTFIQNKKDRHQNFKCSDFATKIDISHLNHS